MVLNPHLRSFVCRHQSLLHFGTPLPQKETSAMRSCLASGRTQSSTSQTALVDVGFSVARLLLSEQIPSTTGDERRCAAPAAPHSPSELVLMPLWLSPSLSLRDLTEYLTLPAVPSHLEPLPQPLPHSPSPLGGSDPRIRGKARISSLPLNAELSVRLWPRPPRGLERTLRPSFSTITLILFVLLFKSGVWGGFEVVI